ncbi:unnamed protein product [Angiostrongylus costaricensis]|uniref:Uncharacterized protein n=1 Tax=Angiostrongylus costaricensis TaxID=334426 RepID=A0A0R3Q2J5_ANGCS|nr:unnamed protein product [Angiostrongylus costaricensis]
MQNLRSGYRQMSSSTDRQLQDRTPRRNVSGSAVPKGAHLFGSARFRRIQQTGIRGDASRDNQTIRGPMNSTTKRRVCSACRVSGSDPVASSSYHSDTSSSSATRALDRLLKTARSPTRHPNSKRRTNDKRTVQLMARSPSANRLIPRPNMTKPARNEEHTAGLVEPEHDSRLLAPVNQLSTQQSSAARGVAVQPSAQRRANHGPPHPRSSVILITPVKRGRGDGTPLRGFRTELRRYPIPTGSTPTHRPLTAFKEFRFHQKVPQNVGDLKLKRVRFVFEIPF